MKRFLSAFLLTLSLAAQAGLPPTSSKISGESVYSTTFKTDFGTFKGTRSGTTLTLNSIGAGAGDSLVLGGTKAASAVLDVQSTTQGVLPPRMTTAQMNAIVSPATGLTIYNTDVNSLASWNGTTWTYGFGNLNPQTNYAIESTITIGATTTPPTKGTIVTDRVLYQRNGQNIKAIYQYEQSAAGSNGSGDYLYSLPAGLSFDTSLITPYSAVGAPIAASEAKAIVGFGEWTDGTSAVSAVKLIAYSSTQFRLLGNLGSSKAFASSSYLNFGLPLGLGLVIDAPISGWSSNTSAWIQANSNPIATTTEFSALVDSSSSVSQLNIPSWVSCSKSSSVYTCTFLASLFSAPPNCSITAYWISGVTSTAIGRGATTSSAITIVTADSGAGDRNFTLNCQRSGADYTAAHSPFIIGTFAGTPNVPGYQGKVDTFSVSYGQTISAVCTASPCGYLKKIGSSSISVGINGTGGLILTAPRTYSLLQCQMTSRGASQPTIPFGSPLSCENCSSLSITTVRVDTWAATDTYGNIDCKGTY